MAVLAHARTPLPLSRSVEVAPPPAGSAPLLQLVEMQGRPKADADDAAGGADAAGAAEGRTVVQLPLAGAPATSSRLQLQLSVDAEGALELRCDAWLPGAEEPQLLASKQLPAQR